MKTVYNIEGKFTSYENRLKRAVERAAFKNFAHAAASIRQFIQSSLKTAEGPSAPGTPPHTHRGAYLRRSIRFATVTAGPKLPGTEAIGAVIGSSAAIVDQAGSAHEMGGEFRNTDFPQRAFAKPGLMANLDRVAGEWAGSIGE